jgi:hypothetical protein
MIDWRDYTSQLLNQVFTSSRQSLQILLSLHVVPTFRVYPGEPRH